MCFPYLNRIQDKTLVLKNQVLSLGICKAIKAVLGLVPGLLESVVLDCNGLGGEKLQYLLEGLKF